MVLYRNGDIKDVAKVFQATTLSSVWASLSGHIVLKEPFFSSIVDDVDDVDDMNTHSVLVSVKCFSCQGGIHLDL